MTDPSSLTPYESIRQRILDDPAASYWLKDAIAQLEERDPADARADCDVLCTIMRMRQKEALAAAFDQVMTPTAPVSNVRFDCGCHVVMDAATRQVQKTRPCSSWPDCPGGRSGVQEV